MEEGHSKKEKEMTLEEWATIILLISLIYIACLIRKWD